MLGIEMPPGRIDRAFRRFQELANRKREVGDDDLRAICAVA
jgi:isopropylmalate/homocitrate/citramalate synthase